MAQTALAMCSLHQFSERLPRYLSYIQGTLTRAIPVEVFCYLLYAFDLIQQNSTWVIFCTQQPDFAAAPVHSKHVPCEHCSCILLRGKCVPESLVPDLRAAVSNCDTVAPIQWEGVCEDIADGFPVDCTGRRYVDQEEKATQLDEEDGASQNPPPPKSTGKQGDGTPAKAKKPKAGASSSQQSPKAASKPRPTRRLARLQPISHRPSRHRMDVVPLMVLTVRCLVTRHHKQTVGSLLERVPNQRHLA